MMRWLMGLVLLWPMGATADYFVTGNSLRDACDSDAADSARIICYGYLTGVADTFRGMSEWGTSGEDGTPIRSCIEDDVTAEDLRLVYLKYVESRAGKLDRGATALVIQSFQSAWSCPD